MALLVNLLRDGVSLDAACREAGVGASTIRELRIAARNGADERTTRLAEAIEAALIDAKVPPVAPGTPHAPEHDDSCDECRVGRLLRDLRSRYALAGTPKELSDRRGAEELGDLTVDVNPEPRG